MVPGLFMNKAFMMKGFIRFLLTKAGNLSNESIMVDQNPWFR